MESKEEDIKETKKVKFDKLGRKIIAENVPIILSGTIEA